MTTSDAAGGTIYHPPGTIRIATPAERAATPREPTRSSEGTVAASGSPAVDPVEWDQALASPEAVPGLIEQHVRAAAALPPEGASEHLRAALALANHALPDDHPRKITWGAVDALRSALIVYHDAVGSTFGPLGVRRHPWRAMAATTEVLGSLLPPRAGGARR